MKKVIIDCDPGMDDSVAIILGAKNPDLKVLAVTTLNGNYPADVTFLNARKIVNLLGADIPVYRGMCNPMIRPAPKDPFTHGEDGQANTFLPVPTTEPTTEHAVNAIARLVKENPGEVSIISTAPMSNIAMALRMYPEIVPMVKEVIAISGSFGLNEQAFANCTGDTPQSEWNVYVDPEAAKLVYESGIKVVAIGLDVATNLDVDFNDEQLARLENSEKKEAWFLSKAINFSHGRGFKAYCAVIDCIAVAYAIDPSLVETKAYHVAVETKEGPTFGMTVRDARHHFVWQNLPMINVAVNADYARYLQIIIDSVLL